jgi:hypothetical protein
VTNRRSPLFWPLGPLPIVLPSLGIIVAVGLSTSTMLPWPYQEWIQTSAEFHQQNAFAGPIAAAAATYFAGRLTPPGRIFALPFAARAGALTARRHLLVLNGSFLVAHLVGFIPLVVATVRKAEHGGPAVLTVLSGLLGLVAAITVGYLLGVVGRSALLAPVSFVLMFTVTVLGTGGDRFAALAPVLHIRPPLGSVETLPFAGYRIAFFVLVITASWFAVTMLLRQHRDGIRRPPLLALAPLLLPAVLVVPPPMRTPALFEFEASPPRVCETHRGVEYCVHAGHRSQLALMTATSDAVLKRYGAPAPTVSRVYDEALRGAYVTFDDRQKVRGLDIVWFPIQPQLPVHGGAARLSSLLAGLQACREHGALPTGDGVPEPYQLAFSLEKWLRDPGGTAPPDSPFHTASVAAVQAWISQHQQAISTCSLTREELPS